MRTKERFEGITEWFATHMPVAETELKYTTAFQLLVAVVLSAQCTDKRVNIVTQELFKTMPTAKEMAAASVEEIFEQIKSISFPNNKAKNLHALANRVLNDFGGEVPDSRESLESLPGVGRKTANVILSVVFDRPAMAVDTHVFRVSERIGLTTGSKSPLETERQLVKHFPEQLLGTAHHWLILHGRYVCTARKPKCEQCGITLYCRHYNKTTR